jgi:hypothetical protein
MASLKKPLDECTLDALMLKSDEARSAYQDQRSKMEVGRITRREHLKRFAGTVHCQCRT